MHTSPNPASEPIPAGTRISRWGEGPIFHGGHLLYVDIEGRAICSFDPSTGLEKEWVLDQRVGFVVPTRDNLLLWGGDHGLYLLDPERGHSTAIADPEPDLPNNRFNDGKCSPDGRLFAGTIALDKIQGNAALYRLDHDRTLLRVASGLTTSNGIGWSPDGRTCYHIDTPTRVVTAYDYDPTSGALANARAAFSTAAIDASPDGLAVDEEGAIWIAFCHGGCVARFRPDGERLARINLPCVETTAVAFGGAHRRDLFVTTGVHKNLEEPLAGRLFVIRDLPVPGLPANLFAG